MSWTETPADSAPRAWTATAWPMHQDWRGALKRARAEIGGLARLLGGGAPEGVSGGVITLPPADRAASDSGGTWSPALAAMLEQAAQPDALVRSAEMGEAGLLLQSARTEAAPKAEAANASINAQAHARASSHAAILMRPPAKGRLRGHGRHTHAPDAADLAQDNVRLTGAAYGDVWLRDTGPVFVKSSTGPQAVAFRFNGWGGRYVYEGDERVAATIARWADAPLRLLEMVGEPGSLDSDGEGTALASKRCLLNANRNPNLSTADAEAILGAAFGFERVLWVEEILANDHTDGHVDTLARFARPGLVVTEAPAGPRDVNAKARDHVALRLDGVRDAQGRAIDVARIAGASAPEASDRAPLPAAHVNYVHAPGRLIVPTYDNSAETAEALADLAGVFPELSIIGAPASGLLTGGGAFHCCTCAGPVEGGPPMLANGADDVREGRAES